MEHSKPHPIQSASHEPMPVPAARPVVLYVEDHPVNVLLMEAVFARRPHVQLVVATTGEQAMHVAAGLNPVLLLLDLNLPDCHGGDLLQQLRTLPGCASAPAVAVTAHHDYAIAGTGFIDLWSKPLDLATVFACLDGLQPGAPTLPPGSSTPLKSESAQDSQMLRMGAIQRWAHA